MDFENFADFASFAVFDCWAVVWFCRLAVAWHADLRFACWPLSLNLYFVCLMVWFVMIFGFAMICERLSTRG